MSKIEEEFFILQEQTKLWSKAYVNAGRMAYPAEYVIRMFRGDYPRLSLHTGGTTTSQSSM